MPKFGSWGKLPANDDRPIGYHSSFLATTAIQTLTVKYGFRHLEKFR